MNTSTLPFSQTSFDALPLGTLTLCGSNSCDLESKSLPELLYNNLQKAAQNYDGSKESLAELKISCNKLKTNLITHPRLLRKTFSSKPNSGSKDNKNLNKSFLPFQTAIKTIYDKFPVPTIKECESIRNDYKEGADSQTYPLLIKDIKNRNLGTRVVRETYQEIRAEKTLNSSKKRNPKGKSLKMIAALEKMGKLRPVKNMSKISVLHNLIKIKEAAEERSR